MRGSAGVQSISFQRGPAGIQRVRTDEHHGDQCLCDAHCGAIPAADPGKPETIEYEVGSSCYAVERGRHDLRDRREKSVHTVLSGPAAGVLGGVTLAKMVGEENVITIDMGGTSFDVSLAYKGRPTFTMESDIGGHIIKIPMIDIKTLGAGGGSIAWVDQGGALRSVPRAQGPIPALPAMARVEKNPLLPMPTLY